MRHQKSGRKLSRTSSHRQAMFRNMAVSLFDHEQIQTTLPKAKELRRVAEPLITLAKSPTVANRRLAFARLRDRAIVGKLFDDLGERFKERPGGYLRILKTGFRSGDKAPMAIVQLVERKVSAGEEGGAKPAKKVAKPAPKKEAKSETPEAKKEKPKEAKKKPAKKKAAAKKTTSKKTAKKTTKKKAAKKKTTKKATKGEK